MEIQTAYGPLAYLHRGVVAIVAEGQESQVVVTDRFEIDLGGENRTLLTLSIGCAKLLRPQV